METALIILAAGMGTRMNSDLPKVLHEIAGAPMLAHAMRAGAALEPARIVVVPGHGGEAVAATARDWDARAEIAVQASLTGHLVFSTIHTNDAPGAFTRLIDMWGSLPGILIALVLATSPGPGNQAAIISIIFWFIPIAARTVIGPARQILVLDYVEAAFAYGRGKWYVLTRHVLPNIGPLVIVLVTILFASAILIEAALAFLGVGAQPQTASWGRLLQESQPLLERAPTLMFFPGVAIVLTVLGFNLLGDGLRIILDPQQSSTSEIL